MRFKLTSAEDDDSGELGWLDSRIPRYNRGDYGPLSGGTGLAHDMLEHFAFKHVGDEIEAHAGIYYIRYEGGWCSKYGQTITPEVLGQKWLPLIRILGGEAELPPVRMNTRPLAPEIERDIESIIQAGKVAVRNELGTYEEEQNEWKLDLAMFAQRFPHYFRIGYRKCQRRYHAHNHSTVVGMFSQLEHKLGKLGSPEFEGEEIRVHVDFKLHRVSLARHEYSEVY